MEKSKFEKIYIQNCVHYFDNIEDFEQFKRILLEFGYNIYVLRFTNYCESNYYFTKDKILLRNLKPKYYKLINYTLFLKKYMQIHNESINYK